MSENLLEVKKLKTQFSGKNGTVTAVDEVSFSVRSGETLGIVGESGCGKSVTSLSILRLIPESAGKIVGGEILFKGEDLLKKTPKQMRHIRGNEIAMIFQDSMTGLNPVLTIGKQLTETITTHEKVTHKEAWDRAVQMLAKVGIPSPEARMKEFPHQLSGGMRQRVMIAMALSCNPKILIADEPTTALDVTIQAQILRLISQLREQMGTSVILITHDLGVVAEVADAVMVMYAGQAVEYAGVGELFARPLHPYTEGLLKSVPVLGRKVDTLYSIPGTVPSPKDYPEGCRFAPRCAYCTPRCEKEAPPLYDLGGGRRVRCFRCEGGGIDG